MLTTIVSAVQNVISNTVGKLIEDKDQANRLEAELNFKVMAQLTETLKTKRDVLISEITGESWLQRNWRPVLMLTIVAIVANNYLVAPYLGAMFNLGLQLELPDPLWNLMTLGVGGYIGGRTIEKGLQTWKGGNEK